MITLIVSRALSFYELLIVIYVLLSWFSASGTIWEIRRVLGTLVEPYLGIFRRIVPPLGMIDISPIIALLVLQLLGSFVLNLLSSAGL